jgi:hypothetical protein
MFWQANAKPKTREIKEGGDEKMVTRAQILRRHVHPPNH